MIELTLALLLQPIPSEAGGATASGATTAAITAPVGRPLSACERLDLYLEELDRHEAEATAVLASSPSAEAFDQALERMSLVINGRTYVGSARRDLCGAGEAAP
jgi:hypothetical protein